VINYYILLNSYCITKESNNQNRKLKKKKSRSMATLAWARLDLRAPQLQGSSRLDEIGLESTSQIAK